MTYDEEFWSKVDRKLDYECWEFPWKGKDGYGLFEVDGVTTRAHRYAWELTRKCKVPEGRMILHMCHNPPCINPHHLYCGTRRDNINDAKARRIERFARGII